MRHIIHTYLTLKDTHTTHYRITLLTTHLPLAAPPRANSRPSRHGERLLRPVRRRQLHDPGPRGRRRAPATAARLRTTQGRRRPAADPRRRQCERAADQQRRRRCAATSGGGCRGMALTAPLLICLFPTSLVFSVFPSIGRDCKNHGTWAFKLVDQSILLPREKQRN